MKTFLFPAAVCVVLLNLMACGPKKDDSKRVAGELNEKKFDDSAIENDIEFAVAVSDAGMLEVQLGKLAQVNGSSSEVKSFGNMMVEDHTQGIRELITLAKEKNISLPISLSTESQGVYNNLAKKTGKAFDDAYTNGMIKGQKEVIEIFKKEAVTGRDAEIKAWASGKISTLEHHFEVAKAAETAVDKMK